LAVLRFHGGNAPKEPPAFGWTEYTGGGCLRFDCFRFGIAIAGLSVAVLGAFGAPHPILRLDGEKGDVRELGAAEAARVLELALAVAERAAELRAVKDAVP